MTASIPHLRQVPLAEAESITSGVAVVIDVLRAFTVAAHAVLGGAAHLRCVGTVEQAVAQRAAAPDRRIAIGEVDGGEAVASFDANNSSTELATMDLHGLEVVHRTSHGVQGLLRSAGADALLAASFPCASATAAAITALGMDTVTFVLTGAGTTDGDEDRALADYLTVLISTGTAPDPTPFLHRVRDSTTGRRFSGPMPDFPPTDLDHAMGVDTVDFALRAQTLADYVRVSAWPPPFALA